MLLKRRTSIHFHQPFLKLFVWFRGFVDGVDAPPDGIFAINKAVPTCQ
jgi:hypothetical protein